MRGEESDGRIVPQAGGNPRDRGGGSSSGLGKAAGEDGWEQKEREKSKGVEDGEFHE